MKCVQYGLVARSVRNGGETRAQQEIPENSGGSMERGRVGRAAQKEESERVVLEVWRVN